MMLAIALGVTAVALGAGLLRRHLYNRAVHKHIVTATAAHHAGNTDKFDIHLEHLAIVQRTRHSLVTAGHRVPKNLHARVHAAQRKP